MQSPPPPDEDGDSPAVVKAGEPAGPAPTDLPPPEIRFTKLIQELKEDVTVPGFNSKLTSSSSSSQIQIQASPTAITNLLATTEIGKLTVMGLTDKDDRPCRDQDQDPPDRAAGGSSNASGGPGDVAGNEPKDVPNWKDSVDDCLKYTVGNIDEFFRRHGYQKEVELVKTSNLDLSKVANKEMLSPSAIFPLQVGLRMLEVIKVARQLAEAPPSVESISIRSRLGGFVESSSPNEEKNYNGGGGGDGQGRDGGGSSGSGCFKWDEDDDHTSLEYPFGRLGKRRGGGGYRGGRVSQNSEFSSSGWMTGGDGGNQFGDSFSRDSSTSGWGGGRKRKNSDNDWWNNKQRKKSDDSWGKSGGGGRGRKTDDDDDDGWGNSGTGSGSIVFSPKSATDCWGESGGWEKGNGKKVDDWGTSVKKTNYEDDWGDDPSTKRYFPSTSGSNNTASNKPIPNKFVRDDDDWE